MLKKQVGMWRTAVGSGPSQRFWVGLAVLMGLWLTAMQALANGYGESGSWNFLTQTDRVNKGYVLDMINKRKNGYDNAIKSTYNYSTYIDKQVNCTLSATTNGTSGTNGLEASASSPVLNNTGTTSASGSANSASNGLSQAANDEYIVNQRWNEVGGRKEVALIDTSVADYQTLVDGVQAGVEVVPLDAHQDGLAQMALWAQTHSGYEAIHILSHGSSGSINLGNTTDTEIFVVLESV